jgi:transcriptional regulator with XRE-family HTH domain
VVRGSRGTARTATVIREFHHTATQEQLAEYANIHTRYLQKLEAGRGHPSLIVLCRLKSALDCQWNALLEGIET